MAIGGLIRGYKRWNPVHPTYGAFWGLGLGLGCGVGWGPGFGPEVVGFVGSGCGVGMSIGVTLVGIGIGLPASGAVCIPCDVVTGAGQQVSQMTTLVVPVASAIAAQTWQSVGSRISLLGERMRSRNQRVGVGSFGDQIAAPGMEKTSPESGDKFRDLNRRSRVRFSTSSAAVHSLPRDIRFECTHGDCTHGK